MRRAGGYAQVVDPEAPTIEFDTFTCKHCNGIVPVKPRQDPSEMGGFCQLCYGHICKGCANHAKCIPFERKLEEMERRAKNERTMRGLKF